MGKRDCGWKLCLTPCFLMHGNILDTSIKWYWQYIQPSSPTPWILKMMLPTPPHPSRPPLHWMMPWPPRPLVLLYTFTSATITSALTRRKPPDHRWNVLGQSPGGTPLPLYQEFFQPQWPWWLALVKGPVFVGHTHGESIHSFSIDIPIVITFSAEPNDPSPLRGWS